MCVWVCVFFCVCVCVCVCFVRACVCFVHVCMCEREKKEKPAPQTSYHKNLHLISKAVDIYAKIYSLNWIRQLFWTVVMVWNWQWSQQWHFHPTFLWQRLLTEIYVSLIMPNTFIRRQMVLLDILKMDVLEILKSPSLSLSLFKYNALYLFRIQTHWHTHTMNVSPSFPLWTYYLPLWNCSCLIKPHLCHHLTSKI